MRSHVRHAEEMQQSAEQAKADADSKRMMWQTKYRELNDAYKQICDAVGASKVRASSSPRIATTAPSHVSATPQPTVDHAAKKVQFRSPTPPKARQAKLTAVDPPVVPLSEAQLPKREKPRFAGSDTASSTSGVSVRAAEALASFGY